MDVYGLLDGYYKVMSNIPKMGHLPTPEQMVENTWILPLNMMEHEHFTAKCGGENG